MEDRNELVSEFDRSIDRPNDRRGVRGCLRKCWEKVTPLVLLAVIIILLNVIILCIVSAIIHKDTATCTCSCEDTQQQTGGLTGGTDHSYFMAALSNLSDFVQQNGRMISNIAHLNLSDVIKKNGQMISNLSDFVQQNYQMISNLSDFVQQNYQMISNLSDFVQQNYQIISNLSDFVQQNDQMITSTLASHGSTGISTAGAVNDVLIAVQRILQIQNVTSLLNSVTPVSCKAIKEVLPNSPTGYYYVNGRNIYCNMDELCGSGGGWTRLTYLDMTDSTQNCPPGFRLYQSGGVRACGRPIVHQGSCTSVQFPSNGISYSQVCGRVTGYQYATPDAVYPGRYQGETYGSVMEPQHNDINSYYVDGVSITRGSPRQHVWTLMAGLNEASQYHGGRYNCPCSQGSPQHSTLQSFIGNDYYCESGNPSLDGTTLPILYTADPLWDGEGCCCLEVNCCTSRPSLPWFNKALGTTTTDYLELRVCGDQGTSDQDVPVSFYELYVK